MKNYYYHFFAVILLVCASCTGNLTGSVFLDLNGDNKKNDDEQVLAGLAIEVTKNDKDFETDTTDSNGEFKVALNGSATYCVVVDDNSLRTSTGVEAVSALVLPTELPLVKFQTVTTETDCDDTLDDDSDGDTDCDDSDCSDDAACASTTETDCDDTLDDDSDGDTDCDDSDCSSNSACSSDSDSTSDDSTTTTESGKVCEDSTGFTWDNDVPVALAYSVDDVSEETTDAVGPGDGVIANLQFPESCEFNVFSIPAGVEPSNAPSGTYDTSNRKMDIQAAIETFEAAGFTFTTNTPLVVNEDPIKTFPLQLVVDDDLVDATDLTLAPTVSCPDDTTVTLSTVTIDIDVADVFAVTHTDNTGGAEVDDGDTVIVTTTVTNNSSADFTDIELVLTISTSTTITFPAACTASGSTSTECTFDLATGASTSFTTSITFPATVTDTTTYTLTGTLTVISGGDTLTETATQSYTIQGEPSSS